MSAASTDTGTWLDNPLVQAILADMKDNPPCRKRWNDWSISSRGKAEFSAYAGKRVEALTEYHKEYLTAASKAADQSGDPSIFMRAYRQPSVEQAICDALAERAAA